MKLYTLLALSTALILPTALQGMGPKYFGAQPIVEALHDGSYTVPALLKIGVDLNNRALGYQTALMLAIEQHSTQVVKVLIDAGVNVNLQDIDGNTALIGAVRRAQWQVIDWLLAAGADLNLQNKKGDTALIIATYLDAPSSVKGLISAGANLNLQDTEGKTALIWAARLGYTHLVKILIQAGAAINLLDNDGNTALMHATYKQRADIVKALVAAGATPPVAPPPANTAPIHRDSSQGLTAKDTTPKGYDGRIIQAARDGNLYMVKQLINKKVDINVQDKQGFTALIWASLYGHSQIVKALIAAGADLTIKQTQPSGGGRTALHEAIRYVNITNALIDAGADINSKSDNKDTPLKCAVFNRWTKVVLELLLAHADVNLTDWMGDTALITAAAIDYPEVIKHLIARGAHLNVQSNYGWTALICAAKNGYTHIVKELIAAGADIMIKDIQGNTALMEAKLNKHRDIVSVLEHEQNRLESAILNGTQVNTHLTQSPVPFTSTPKGKKRPAVDTQESPAKRRALNDCQEAPDLGIDSSQNLDQGASALSTGGAETPGARLRSAIARIQVTAAPSADQRNNLQRKIDILFILTTLGKTASFIPYLEQFTPERTAHLRKVLGASKANSTLIAHLQQLAPHAQPLALYMLARTATSISESNTRHFAAALLSYELTARALGKIEHLEIADLDTIAPHAEEYTQNLLGIAEDQFKLLADYITAPAKTLTQAQLCFLCYELFALSAESAYGQQLFFEALALGDQQLITDALAVLSESCAKHLLK